MDYAGQNAINGTLVCRESNESYDMIKTKKIAIYFSNGCRVIKGITLQNIIFEWKKQNS